MPSWILLKEGLSKGKGERWREETKGEGEANVEGVAECSKIGSRAHQKSDNFRIS